jgi:hypothetical protein
MYLAYMCDFVINLFTPQQQKKEKKICDGARQSQFIVVEQVSKVVTCLRVEVNKKKKLIEGISTDANCTEKSLQFATKCVDHKRRKLSLACNFIHTSFN